MRKKGKGSGMEIRTGRKRAAAVLGAVLSVMSMPGMTALADNTQVIMIGGAGKEENMAQNKTEQPGAGKDACRLGVDVAGLPAAEETDQLVVVVGSGMDSSSVTVAYCRKDDTGVWTEEFCVPGYCGYHGMAADKREGDRRTPVGTYGFVSTFGILPDPGSVTAYRQLREGDFWVDDSNSRYYNQLVNAGEVEWDWNSAEELLRIAPAYHYVLALDYNTAERIPGKGSAIFLHGIDPKKTWTEGCIAIPEERVKQLVQELKETARIVIMPSV